MTPSQREAYETKAFVFSVLGGACFGWKAAGIAMLIWAGMLWLTVLLDVMRPKTKKPPMNTEN